jgi:hypothetical protein
LPPRSPGPRRWRPAGRVGDDAPDIVLDTRLLEAEPLQIRLSPHGNEHPLREDLFPSPVLSLNCEGDPTLPVGQTHRLRPGNQADPLGAKCLEQMVDRFTVGHRQKARGHLDDRRLHAEPTKGRSILEAVNATAQDDERSGQVIEPVEGFVGEIVDVGKPRDLRDERGCARGDDELPGGKDLFACADAVRVDEGRWGRYHADADPLEGLREVLFVGLPDDAPDVGHDPGAVQACGQGQQAQTLQVRHVAAYVAEPDQGLARDAGQVGAVSADP